MTTPDGSPIFYYKDNLIVAYAPPEGADRVETIHTVPNSRIKGILSNALETYSYEIKEKSIPARRLIVKLYVVNKSNDYKETRIISLTPSTFMTNAANTVDGMFHVPSETLVTTDVLNAYFRKKYHDRFVAKRLEVLGIFSSKVSLDEFLNDTRTSTITLWVLNEMISVSIRGAIASAIKNIPRKMRASGGYATTFRGVRDFIWDCCAYFKVLCIEKCLDDESRIKTIVHLFTRTNSYSEAFGDKGFGKLVEILKHDSRFKSWNFQNFTKEHDTSLSTLFRTKILELIENIADIELFKLSWESSATAKDVITLGLIYHTLMLRSDGDDIYHDLFESKFLVEHVTHLNDGNILCIREGETDRGGYTKGIDQRIWHSVLRSEIAGASGDKEKLDYFQKMSRKTMDPVLQAQNLTREWRVGKLENWMNLTTKEISGHVFQYLQNTNVTGNRTTQTQQKRDVHATDTECILAKIFEKDEWSSFLKNEIADMKFHSGKTQFAKKLLDYDRYIHITKDAYLQTNATNATNADQFTDDWVRLLSNISPNLDRYKKDILKLDEIDAVFNGSGRVSDDMPIFFEHGDLRLRQLYYEMSSRGLKYVGEFNAPWVSMYMNKIGLNSEEMRSLDFFYNQDEFWDEFMSVFFDAELMKKAKERLLSMFLKKCRVNIVKRIERMQERSDTSDDLLRLKDEVNTQVNLNLIEGNDDLYTWLKSDLNFYLYDSRHHEIDLQYCESSASPRYLFERGAVGLILKIDKNNLISRLLFLDANHPMLRTRFRTNPPPTPLPNADSALDNFCYSIDLSNLRLLTEWSSNPVLEHAYWEARIRPDDVKSIRKEIHEHIKTEYKLQTIPYNERYSADRLLYLKVDRVENDQLEVSCWSDVHHTHITGRSANFIGKFQFPNPKMFKVKDHVIRDRIISSLKRDLDGDPQDDIQRLEYEDYMINLDNNRNKLDQWGSHPRNSTDPNDNAKSNTPYKSRLSCMKYMTMSDKDQKSKYERNIKIGELETYCRKHKLDSDVLKLEISAKDLNFASQSSVCESTNTMNDWNIPGVYKENVRFLVHDTMLRNQVIDGPDGAFKLRPSYNKTSDLNFDTNVYMTNQSDLTTIHVGYCQPFDTMDPNVDLDSLSTSMKVWAGNFTDNLKEFRESECTKSKSHVSSKIKVAHQYVNDSWAALWEDTSREYDKRMSDLEVADRTKSDRLDGLNNARLNNAVQSRDDAIEHVSRTSYILPSNRDIGVFSTPGEEITIFLDKIPYKGMLFDAVWYRPDHEGLIDQRRGREHLTGNILDFKDPNDIDTAPGVGGEWVRFMGAKPPNELYLFRNPFLNSPNELDLGDDLDWEGIRYDPNSVAVRPAQL